MLAFPNRYMSEASVCRDDAGLFRILAGDARERTNQTRLQDQLVDHGQADVAKKGVSGRVGHWQESRYRREQGGRKVCQRPRPAAVLRNAVGGAGEAGDATVVDAAQKYRNEAEVLLRAGRGRDRGRVWRRT